MTKIAFLTTVHPIDDNRIYYKELLSLRKNGFAVELIAQCAGPSTLRKENVLIHCLPLPVNHLDRLFRLQFIAFYKMIRNRFEVVHFHDPELIFLAWILKVFLRKKIIFDIHENVRSAILDRYWIPKNLRLMVSRLYSTVERFLISFFDAVIIAETSYRKIYGTKPVELLNFPRINNIEENIDKKYKKPIRFVYTGVIASIRGINQMLEAFGRLIKQYPDIRLDLVGNILPVELEQQIKQRIASENLSSHVIIHGRKNIFEVYEILAESHIGFSLLKPVHNYLESLPTKIFEYMQAGLAVLVSDFPYYDDYVKNAGTGFAVDYDSVDDIVEKAAKLIEDPDLIKKMGERGKEMVRQKWNWDTEERKLIALYSEILNHRIPLSNENPLSSPMV